jgi:hypothetical protein
MGLQDRGLRITVPVARRRSRAASSLPRIACTALSVADGRASTNSPRGLAAVLLGVALARPDALGMGDVQLALLLAVGLDVDAPWPLVLNLILAVLGGVGLLARYGRAAGCTALPLAPFLWADALLALRGTTMRAGERQLAVVGTTNERRDRAPRCARALPTVSARAPRLPVPPSAAAIDESRTSRAAWASLHGSSRNRAVLKLRCANTRRPYDRAVQGRAFDPVLHT